MIITTAYAQIMTKDESDGSFNGSDGQERIGVDPPEFPEWMGRWHGGGAS